MDISGSHSSILSPHQTRRSLIYPLVLDAPVDLSSQEISIQSFVLAQSILVHVLGHIMNFYIVHRTQTIIHSREYSILNIMVYEYYDHLLYAPRVQDQPLIKVAYQPETWPSAGLLLLSSSHRSSLSGYLYHHLVFCGYSVSCKVLILLSCSDVHTYSVNIL